MGEWKIHCGIWKQGANNNYERKIVKLDQSNNGQDLDFWEISFVSKNIEIAKK